MGVLTRFNSTGPVALWSRAEIAGDPAAPVMLRVTRNAALHPSQRRKHAYFAGQGLAAFPTGFGAVLCADESGITAPTADCPLVRLPPELRYIEEDDVLRIDARRQRVDVLYRKASEHNTVLVTDRCNSRCLMCSQPPKLEDDGHLVGELLQAIPLMSTETEELGVTGGEPTLLFDGLIRIIQAARDALPATRLHVLSNGRLFAYTKYAADVAQARHPGLIFGVPLYSAVPGHHDFVVQARGAFDQTIRGLMNLARYGIRIELRVVVHRQTYKGLARLAEFIVRNLAFAEHVALMGLETIGFTRPNLESLWIDPAEYQEELAAATHIFDRARMKVSIYNHQLCLLRPDLWKFAVRSISDWKNIYMPECDGCVAKPACGGFFASAHLRYSKHIRAFGSETSAPR